MSDMKRVFAFMHKRGDVQNIIYLIVFIAAILTAIDKFSVDICGILRI